MKKILFSLIVLTIISCTKEEKPVDYVVFSGKIENPDGGKFSVRSSTKVLKDFNVMENGSFADTLKNIEEGYFTFKYANETSSLYLKPGFNINLSINPNEFDESIKYTGNGSKENNYLAQKLLNEEALGKISSYQYLGTLSENEFIHKMDSVKELKTNYLESQTELEDNFIVLERGSILYAWANKMYDFEAYKHYVDKNNGFKVSDDYKNFTKDLNFEDESLIEVNDYKSYLKKHYNMLISKESTEGTSDRQTAYLTMVSKEVKSSKIKEYLLYADAFYGISYTENLQGYYDVFMANSIDEEHKKDITQKYDKLIKVSKGHPSPKFVDYENYSGGTTSLDDLKGKYVYVDVWATWCGPCIREIPSLKKIEKQYHDKNIAFVSMSVDRKTDYDKWRKMVEEEELSGIQLYAPKGNKSEFYKNYGIMGIPRFILIDPEGDIVNSNAPRPSSEKLTETFEELGI